MTSLIFFVKNLVDLLSGNFTGEEGGFLGFLYHFLRNAFGWIWDWAEWWGEVIEALTEFFSFLGDSISFLWQAFLKVMDSLDGLFELLKEFQETIMPIIENTANFFGPAGGLIITVVIIGVVIAIWEAIN